MCLILVVLAIMLSHRNMRHSLGSDSLEHCFVFRVCIVCASVVSHGTAILVGDLIVIIFSCILSCYLHF